MRNTEDLHQGSRTGRQAQARRVGAYLAAAATAAGFDIRRRKGGRAQLAALTGLSLTTISRTLDGRTLPLPTQLVKWATALGLDHQAVLTDSGLIPARRAHRTTGLASVALSPDEAMHAWGISDPIIRKTLAASIVHAIRLQEELDAAADREAVAPG